MGTTLKSDGFRLSLSTGIFLALVAGLVFIVRIDDKANKGLEKFDAMGMEVRALRQEMKEDRQIINAHSVELREHRTLIHELQRKHGQAEGWGER